MNKRFLISLATAALVLLPPACSPVGNRPAPEEPVNWQAQWIGAPWDGEEYDRATVLPAPEFRRNFTAPARIRKATAHVSGLGFFEFRVNGEKVGDEVLTPHESSYGHRTGLEKGSIPMDDTHWRGFRVYYLDYDITDLLHEGENTLSALLGNGMFATGRLRWVAPYGTPRFLCQVEIEYADGQKETLVSDPSWEVRRSPIVLNDLFDGEIYDARLEDSGPWEKAVLRKAPDGKMVRQDGPPDRVTEVLAPRTLRRLPDGRWEADFGDYVTGWIRLNGIDAPEGTEISIEFPIEGNWNGVYKYICPGGKVGSYAPRFCWWTFEKAVISGWPGEMTPDNIRAEVVHADVRETARFDCSDTMLVRLHQIWKRTQTDNMHLGVASDCPHREKGPYTGDGQVASGAVLHNFDADSFYRKWLRDMSDCQDTLTGYVPNGAPWHPGCGGGVGWGAAMCIIPWEHYLHYGDPGVLEEHYAAMAAQLAFMEGWRTGEGIMEMKMPDAASPLYWMNLGEWFPAAKLPEDRLVHTYFLWKCAGCLARTARALGREEDAQRYAALEADVCAAFHRVFYRPEEGSYGDHDGANVFALKMGVPPERKAQVLASLRKEIDDCDNHLVTGIFGTQILFDVLCDNGLEELAFEIMTQKTPPGFGWWLEQGAHTMWEDWRGENSRNHPMFGGGLVWLYTRLAGLQIDEKEPAYRHMIVRPTPVQGLQWASYETETPRGTASVRWDVRDGQFTLEVGVPRGAHASVYLPGEAKPVEIRSGKHRFSKKLETGSAVPDAQAFARPPKHYWPETWFHFIGDNVSREGVEADLKAIHDARIGGVQWFHGHFGGRWPGVDKPVEPLSPEWDEMVAHMGRTASRLGLRLSVQTCPGWAMAGGPWIEAEDAMRELVWSRTDVPSAARFDGRLERGKPSDEPWRDYSDICVLAFPTPEGDTGTALELQDVRSDSEAWTAMLQGTGHISEVEATTHTARFRLPEGAVIRTLEMPSVESLGRAWCNVPGVTIVLEAVRADGSTETLVDAQLPMASWQDKEPFYLAVNERRDAVEYVLTFRHEHPMNLRYIRFHSASRQDDWPAAAGRTLRAKELYQGHARRSPESYVARRDVLDISDLMGTDGQLSWQVPDTGKGWTILRFGHVNAGYKNGPAPPEATGWECNKLDRRGARVQFANYVGRLQKGPLQGRADGMLMDSWECYNQTWSPDMEAQFSGENGYALRSWLPALTGYVLDDTETTARFLTDWRRTLTALYTREFFAQMVEQAHEAGLRVQFETAAADVVAMDPLEYYQYADTPMCEFWHPIEDSFVGSLNFKPIKPTASAAHLYGKKRVDAESFTSFDLSWDEHWEMLKEVANLNMTEGVTHNVFHTYTHNPQVDFLPPGTSFGNSIGTPFLRGQTWWKYMPHFTQYLARVSYMLEQGRPVADVLWYLGDEVGNKPDQLAPFPEGFKYDYCNPDILLHRLCVKDGKLLTPEGLSYAVLWIPENERMLPETVSKLYELIRAGARVVAGPPQNLATLRADAAAEKRFHRCVEAIWKEKCAIRRLGKGCIAWDVPLEEALAAFGLKPHLTASGGSVLWSEREAGGMHWYYVTAPVGGDFHGSLRLIGKGAAECWDPVSGTVSRLESEGDGDYRTVQLDLERAENCFVVFREDADSPATGSWKLSGATRTALSPGRWTLRFPEGWGAPKTPLQLDALVPWKDLPVSAEARAFSGTVRYETRFELPAEALGKAVVLDLGRVDMIADVRVNGHPAGVRWARPYRLEIGPYLKEGVNELSIDVTGTWFNRLAYDAALPEAKRKTWTIAGPAPGSPLRESGLLGPVCIEY